MQISQKVLLLASVGIVLTAGGCKAFRAAFDEPERARVRAGEPPRRSSFFSLQRQQEAPSMLQQELSAKEYQLMQQYSRDNAIKRRDPHKESDEEKARRKWVF